MITLSNGHSFVVATAAGALGYDGRGYWWEKYGLIPLGVIDPSLFTIITKTLTIKPRRGNVRWWRPCVWPLAWSGGAVNQMGLPNPGIHWLMRQYDLGRFPAKGLPTIVSVTPESPDEGYHMARLLDRIPDIKGIEVNVSCPNVKNKPMDKEEKVEHIRKVFRGTRGATDHPVGIKLGWLDPYREVCDILDGEADWFDLINTVPWGTVFPTKTTPMRFQGLDSGGVSGPAIAKYAEDALRNVYYFHADGLTRNDPPRTPIISGGGVTSGEIGLRRLANGAAAVTVGTTFLTRPWRVNGIARTIIESVAHD